MTTKLEALKLKLSTKQEELVQAKQDVANFELDESEYVEQYKDLIDECTEEVVIMGMSFTPSRILEELDPIAFNCGLSDYVDGIDLEGVSAYKELEQLVEDLESDVDWLEVEIDTLENEEDEV